MGRRRVGGAVWVPGVSGACARPAQVGVSVLAAAQTQIFEVYYFRLEHLDKLTLKPTCLPSSRYTRHYTRHYIRLRLYKDKGASLLLCWGVARGRPALRVLQKP